MNENENMSESPATDVVTPGQQVADDVPEVLKSSTENVTDANVAMLLERIEELSRRVGEAEQRVSEAEQRGYTRGRNESIERLMARPGVFESLQDDGAVDADMSEVMILNNLRPSVWDR